MDHLQDSTALTSEISDMSEILAGKTFSSPSSIKPKALPTNSSIKVWDRSEFKEPIPSKEPSEWDADLEEFRRFSKNVKSVLENRQHVFHLM